MGKHKLGVPRIAFEYIKSNSFRVMHADGVHGGVSPRLDIHMAVFTERAPFPKEIYHFLKPDGMLGAEDFPNRKGRKGFIREIDADIIMDVQVAKVLVTWLNDKIKQVEDILAVRKENLP